MQCYWSASLIYTCRNLWMQYMQLCMRSDMLSLGSGGYPVRNSRASGNPAATDPAIGKKSDMRPKPGLKAHGRPTTSRSRLEELFPEASDSLNFRFPEGVSLSRRVHRGSVHHCLANVLLPVLTLYFQPKSGFPMLETIFFVDVDGNEMLSNLNQKSCFVDGQC